MKVILLSWTETVLSIPVARCELRVKGSPEYPCIVSSRQHQRQGGGSNRTGCSREEQLIRVTVSGRYRGHREDVTIDCIEDAMWRSSRHCGRRRHDANVQGHRQEAHFTGSVHFVQQDAQCVRRKSIADSAQT